MRNTTYRQPEWYRYVDAFRRYADVSDVVVVENPYGGVVPELIEALAQGRGYDRLRLSLYEAAAFGANMSVPYGSWMGATIQDSFWAPHDLLDRDPGLRRRHRGAALARRAPTRSPSSTAWSARATWSTRPTPATTCSTPATSRVEVPFRRVTETLSRRVGAVRRGCCSPTAGWPATGSRADDLAPLPHGRAARLLVADRPPGRPRCSPTSTAAAACWRPARSAPTRAGPSATGCATTRVWSAVEPADVVDHLADGPQVVCERRAGRQPVPAARRPGRRPPGQLRPRRRAGRGARADDVRLTSVRSPSTARARSARADGRSPRAGRDDPGA